MASRLIDQLRGRVKRQPELAGWIVVTAGLIIYLVLAEARELFGDGMGYWRSAEHFSSPLAWWDHNNALRGYAFPWLLRLAATVVSPFSADPGTVARVLSLITVPLLVCLIAPSLAKRLSPDSRVEFVRIIALGGAFALLWHIDLLHPLSDLPALAMVGAGVLGLLRAGELSRRTGALVALGSGVLLGLALNTRPAYLLAVIVAIAGLWLIQRHRSTLAVTTATAVLGVALALLPQVIVNERHHDQISPVPVDSSSLTRFQLFQGLAMQRYETYVGPGRVFSRPPPQMVFETRIAHELPERQDEFESLGEYLSFVAERPVPVADTYARHLFNGLDARFGGSYVEDVATPNLVLPLVNFILLVAAGAVLVLRVGTAWRNPDHTWSWRGPTTWFVLVLAAACLPPVTGAMEARFLLPLHLTLLATLAFGADRRLLPSSGIGRLALGAATTTALVLCILISSATMRSYTEGPLGFDGAWIEVPDFDGR